MKQYLTILIASLTFSQADAQHEHHQQKTKPVQPKEQQDKKQEEHHDMRQL